MGFFKSLVDKMKDKQAELGKKAAKAALDQGAKAAKGAFASAGKAIERALFGDAEEPEGHKDELQKPDPFAKLKAAEAKKKLEK